MKKPTIKIFGKNDSNGLGVPKPIEIGFMADADGDWSEECNLNLNDFKFVTLLCLNYFTEVNDYYDLFILHYTTNPSDSSDSCILCRGNWNDGVVSYDE